MYTRIILHTYVRTCLNVIVLHRFHEVYSGNAVSHRLTRLLSDTEYVMRVAATSESGQGAWSDDVTFMTTPSLPPAPTGKLRRSHACVCVIVTVSSFVGLMLRQESKDTLKLCWQAVGEDQSYSVSYEVQVNSPLPGEDFVQVRKNNTARSLTLCV